MLGGGMRQAGVIAAAGLVALDTMVERLEDDHRHARLLAEGLGRLPGVVLVPRRVQTNIVIFRLDPALDARDILARCRQAGLLLTDMGNGDLRAVTHADVTAEDCDRAVATLAQVLATSD
jgi:threonine aldolase